MVVLNLTKNEINPDQEEALRQMGYSEWTPPRSMFLKTGADLCCVANGKAVIITAPWEIIAEAINDGLTAHLIAWRSDQSLRSRGLFALAGVKRYIFEGGVLQSKEEILVRPNWANDFRKGTLISL